MSINQALELAIQFEKLAELSAQETEWLSHTPPLYRRPDASGKTPEQIAEDIRTNPLSHWDINGIKHTVDILTKLKRSYRLQRKSTVSLSRTIKFFLEVLLYLDK